MFHNLPDAELGFRGEAFTFKPARGIILGTISTGWKFIWIIGDGQLINLSLQPLAHGKNSVLESGEVIEIYWPDIPNGKVRLDDIERLDVGGPDDAIIDQEKYR